MTVRGSASRSSAVAAICACAIVAAGCGGGDNKSTAASDSGTSGGSGQQGGGSGASGGTLNVGSYSEPASLDPQKTDDDAQYPITWRVYEALTDFDANGKLVPLLAAQAPKPMGKTTWRVKVRPNVKFHDGAPFNADAAVFSIKRIISPQEKTSIAEAAAITGVKKVDDSTIDITTKGSDPILPYQLRAIKMLEPGKVDFKHKVIGTGPYKLTSYDAGQGATLQAFAGYWGDKPSIQKVAIRFIPDTSTRLQALKAGEIDLMLGLPPEQSKEAPQALATKQGVAGGFVRINTYKGIFKDRNVRDALNMAIDKKALSSVFNGYADAANCQMTPPQAFGTDASLQPIPYDPAKAKQILQDAGAAGQTVEVSWSNGTFPNDREVGQAVAEFWRQAGLKVDFHSKEFNPWLKDILAHGPTAPDLVFTESDNALNNADRQIDQYYRSGTEVSTYDNPQLDSLLTKAQGTFDDAARQQLYEQIDKMGCDDRALVYLYFRKELLGASQRLHYSPHADIATRLYYDEMSLGG